MRATMRKLFALLPEEGCADWFLKSYTLKDTTVTQQRVRQQMVQVVDTSRTENHL